MTETGPERIRAAIKRDRGGDAPSHPVRVCGPECRGEEVPAPEVGPTCLPSSSPLIDSIFDRLICPACIRLRFSPIHLFYRLIGICDGRNGW